MIRKLTACLTTILEEAVDDGHLERNPARSRRMRVRVSKPARTFLEMDELVALTDAAGEQDAKFARPKLPVKPAPGSTAAKVAERWLAGKRAFEISDELGLARATVTYHLRRMQAKDPGSYIGRRAIVATLGGSGVRVSELCDIRIRELRLHAASGAHFRIPDAEAGIRGVQVSPDLLEEIIAHIDRLRRAEHPTGPDAFLFPNRKGRRMTRQRPSAIVRDAANARIRQPGRARVPHAPQHQPAYAPPDLHLDRAAREPLRCALGDAAGRPRRLAYDDERLRAAAAARGAPAR
jgi:integrase